MEKVLLLLLIPLLMSCASPTRDPMARIVPQLCQLEPGEEMPFGLEGSLPEEAEITWAATDGVVRPTVGSRVIYTAPMESESVLVTARVSKAGTNVTYLQIQCEIVQKGVESPPVVSGATAVFPLSPTAIGNVQTCTVGDNKIDLHAGPYMKAPVEVYGLEKGTQLSIKYRTPTSEWFFVETLDGFTGWAFYEWLDLTGVDIAVVPILEEVPIIIPNGIIPKPMPSPSKTPIPSESSLTDPALPERHPTVTISNQDEEVK